MSQSLVDVILHLVFSTKNRCLWIKADIEEELYQYIAGIGNNLDCPVIQINGMEDHIHLLVQLGKTVSISKLVSEMKSNSSRWIKTKSEYYGDFGWQSGYGVFSVSRPNLDSAKRYLSSQKEHHKVVTFQEEFLSMLNRAEIPYDEKHLWD